MKYTKVKDLNLSDDILLAKDTTSYVNSALNTALSGMNFQIRDPNTAPLRDVINDLSACICSIVARFSGKINNQSLNPSIPDNPDNPSNPDNPATNSYVVMFIDWNEETLDAQIVNEGSDATPPPEPVREGYKFIGWSADFTNVHEGLVIYAQYEEITTPDNPPVSNTYSVTFADWNGTVLKQDTVEEGHDATPPPNPSRDGYEFIGWSISFIDVRSDLIVFAQYEEIQQHDITFTVKFFDELSTALLCSVTVEDGAEVVPPSPSLKNGYHFDKWIPENYSPVHSNLSVYASYLPNKYVVTFDGNGGVPEFISTEVTYGEPYGRLPSCSFEGNGFDGWWTKISGDGMLKVISSDVFNQTENQILYAHWTDDNNMTDEEISSINQSIQALIQLLNSIADNDQYEPGLSSIGLNEQDDEDDEYTIDINDDQL